MMIDSGSILLGMSILLLGISTIGLVSTLSRMPTRSPARASLSGAPSQRPAPSPADGYVFDADPHGRKAVWISLVAQIIAVAATAGFTIRSFFH